MSATLTLTGKTWLCWKAVAVDDEQSFEILVRAPTLDEQLRDHELLLAELVDATGRRCEHRLRSAIIDWRSLLDDTGQPIPFTWENLTVLVAQRPRVFGQVMAAANDAFSGLERASPEQRKNSAGPAGGPSAEPQSTPALPAS